MGVSSTTTFLLDYKKTNAEERRKGQRGVWNKGETKATTTEGVSRLTVGTIAGR